MSQPDWTRPADLRGQLQKRWDRGELLRACLPQAEPMFPLQLRLKKPNSNDLGNRFEQVRHWISQLQQLDARYRLQYREINHRQLGRNQIPDSVWIYRLEDALQLLGQQRAARQFEHLAHTSLDLFPALHPWLSKHPLRALEQAAYWQQILAVLHWFSAHPHSQLYLRQLDIPGVDTKFIEQRRGLLGELLDLVLPATHINEQSRGVKGFCRRYGLLDKPQRIRMRILDPRLAIAGLTDLEVPVEQLAGLQLPLARVFVTENEVNALAFPELPDSVLLFGQGYALDVLGQIPWLHKQPLYYWGDIDTHGFAILNRLRTYLPHTQSMLMDHSTLLQHQALWGQEPADTACTSELPLLTCEEQSLYQALRENSLCNDDGQPFNNLRFEQEQAGFNWLQHYLQQL